jgi:hypothetical protein
VHRGDDHGVPLGGGSRAQHVHGDPSCLQGLARPFLVHVEADHDADGPGRDAVVQPLLDGGDQERVLLVRGGEAPGHRRGTVEG